MTLPAVGRASPEIKRSKVDFPEPERPSRPTISFSTRVKLMSLRTSISLPSGLGKAWQHDRICSSASLMVPTPSPKPEFSFRVPVKRPPKRAIDDDYIETHHRDSEHDTGKITRFGCPRDIGAKAGGLQFGIAPGRHFRDDAGVPRAAGRGDGAGDVKW